MFQTRLVFEAAAAPEASVLLGCVLRAALDLAGRRGTGGAQGAARACAAQACGVRGCHCALGGGQERAGPAVLGASHSKGSHGL